MTTELPAQLARLAKAIERPREEDGTPATLEALLPCEPAIGDVAVACWSDSAGGELLELVRLDSGERVGDQVALREALTLLAMVETMEELASFDELDALASGLEDWQPALEHVGADLPPEFARARERALETLRALRGLEPTGEARVARPTLLDELGAALRSLETAWIILEQQAEAWSEALLARYPGDPDVLDRVQVLWRLLAVARRGPLAMTPGAALQAGREAGVAMAAQVTSAGAAG